MASTVASSSVSSALPSTHRSAAPAAAAARASQPSARPASSSPSSSMPSAAPPKGGPRALTSSSHRSVASDNVNMGDVVQRGRHEGSSGSSSDMNSHSSDTASSARAPYAQQEADASHLSREQPSQSQREPLVLDGAAEGSPPPSHRSATTTATTATASASAVRDTHAGSVGGRVGSRTPPPHSPQQHEPHQRPTPILTPPVPFGDADVARVRAALADAGYPNPSWADIQRVFDQMAQNTNNTTSEAPMAESREVDALGYTVPSARAPTTLTEEKGSLLHYLDPSLRLERYIQQRERELESMCLRPPPTPLRTAANAFAPPCHPAQEGQQHTSKAAAGTRTTPGDAPARTGQPAASPPQRQRGGVDGVSAQHRRAANIVFNITGDRRFRFFPATRTPQGSGALTAASIAPPRTTAAREGGGENSARNDSVGAHSRRAVPPATTSAAHRTPCPNYYNPQRSALGGGGVFAVNSSTSRTGGHHPLPFSRGGSAASPSVLSCNSLSYLDPQGCTLRHRADPVKRGQQMRVLWEKDSFLSQRRRPQEAWRTRQITMAYEQETAGQ